MTTVATVKLYPDYPDGATNAEREALDAELQKSFTEQLESEWFCMDCGALEPKYIMSCCETVVESNDYSSHGGTGPGKVNAVKKDGGTWNKVGDLHETGRILYDATVNPNVVWEVSAGGVKAQVHATYRVAKVQSFP